MDYTAASLAALIADAVPESQTLEFKESQDLQTRPQKGELLKDLTGMGNGGGGTVLYGIEEDAGGDNTAAALRALTDPGFPGRMENVVRTGVSPPLLYRLRAIQIAGGFVLEAVIEPSPLGPYMVTSYGATEGRYFRRHGISVDAMSEREVRDAYALALRAAEHRPTVWADHSLPLAFNNEPPRVCVAALPLEPLPELLDLRSVGRDDIQLPPALSPFVNGACDTAVAVASSVLWADGFAGTARRALARLHRDGAAGLAQELPETMAPWAVARVADGMLTYLGWLWQKFDLRRPVELQLSIEGLTGLRLDHSPHGRDAVQPAGIDVTSVALVVEQQPWDVARPSSRHKLVRALTDRLAQAYGLPWVEVPFTLGHLYGAGGSILEMTMRPDLAMIWSLRQNAALGSMDVSGTVKSVATGRPVAHVDGGVILDLAGDTLAVVELGVGPGYPSDCYPAQRATTELSEPGAGQLAPAPQTAATPAPEPTGQWSTVSLRSTLEDQMS